MRFKQASVGLALRAGILFVSMWTAKADLMVYRDRASWQLASSNLETISFAGLGGVAGDPQYPDRYYPNGLAIDGVTFTGGTWGGGAYLYVRSGNDFLYGPPDGNLGCPTQIGTNPPCSPNAGITVTFPDSITSVGWEFGNFYLPGVTVKFSNGVAPSDPDFAGFIGFTSDSPITTITIHSAGFPEVSNFEFGSAVPEPGSVLLLLTIVAVFAIRGYCRKVT